MGFWPSWAPDIYVVQTYMQPRHPLTSNNEFFKKIILIREHLELSLHAVLIPTMSPVTVPLSEKGRKVCSQHSSPMVLKMAGTWLEWACRAIAPSQHGVT